MNICIHVFASQFPPHRFRTLRILSGIFKSLLEQDHTPVKWDVFHELFDGMKHFHSSLHSTRYPPPYYIR